MDLWFGERLSLLPYRFSHLIAFQWIEWILPVPDQRVRHLPIDGRSHGGLRDCVGLAGDNRGEADGFDLYEVDEYGV